MNGLRARSRSKFEKARKMTHIQTLRLVYFSGKIDFEHATNKNIVDLD